MSALELKPVLKDGQPVDAKATVAVNFRLS